MPELSEREFSKIRELSYRHFGLDLRGDKQMLVAARLGKKLRELGMSSFQEYYDHVTSDKSGEALAGMVDFLTTNHTSFFREPRHFEYLRKTVYPQLCKRTSIKIWSAACSSGEEPYTIAMSLLEESPAAEAKVRIRATDISTRVLQRAKRGVYPANRFPPDAAGMLPRYLLKGHGPLEGQYRFKDSVRSMIDFEHLNLMQDLGTDYRCSVIFCRNVMIYFDKETQQDLVCRLANCLEDGGYLFLGHSESLNGLTHPFQYIAPATYRKPAGTGEQRRGRD